MDFSKALETFEGVPIKDGEDDLTYRKVITAALLSNEESELSKADRYSVAYRLQEDDCVLTNKEKAAIEVLVDKLYFPLVVGQVHLFLS
jgi:hypothetical protein